MPMVQAPTKHTVVACLFVTASLICTGSLTSTFLALPSKVTAPTLSTGTHAKTVETKPIGNCQGAVAVMGAGFLLGGAAALLRRKAPPRRADKIAARYTTEVITPAFTWVKANIKDKDIGPGDLVARMIGGCDVVVGKTESGQLFAVGDKAPPTGTSLSIGGEVIGDTVRDGQYGSSFDVFTGDVVEWCTSPPVIAQVIGNFMGGPQMLAVFDVRSSFFGGDVEVLVDLNAKKAYEANYWKGLLDSQGKDDGTYY